MQIVIDIEDNTYEAIKHEYCILPPQKGLLKALWDAIHNGTPLPKGHGDLVDISPYKGKIICSHLYSGVKKLVEVDNIEPIIEADRKEQE